MIRDARVDGALVDLAIAGERIAAIGGPLEAAETLDAGGRLVSPAFVEPHIHLDKVLIRPAARAQPHRDAAPRRSSCSHAVKRAATVEEIRDARRAA